jgi:hypothetical protein
MIQVIRYKCCNKIFAACKEPECYTSKEWQKDVRTSANKGDKIEMVNNGEWQFEKCECDKIQTESKNQLKLTL